MDEIKPGSFGYLPFYYERFAWSTKAWGERCARMVYLDLICQQYSDGFLVNDPKILDTQVPGALKHWDLIRPKFLLCDDGYLRNQVCDRLRTKNLVKSDTNRKNGKLGGEANAKRSVSEREAFGKQATEQQSNRSTEQRISKSENIESEKKHSSNRQAVGHDSVHSSHPSNLQEPEEGGFPAQPCVVGENPPADPTEENGRSTDNRSGSKALRAKSSHNSITDAECMIVWQQFPRKVGRAAGFRAIKKACATIARDEGFEDAHASVVWLAERVEFAAAQWRKNGTAPEYIPHPATWLNAGRWNDEFEDTSKPPSVADSIGGRQ